MQGERRDNEPGPRAGKSNPQLPLPNKGKVDQVRFELIVHLVANPYQISKCLKLPLASKRYRWFKLILWLIYLQLVATTNSWLMANHTLNPKKGILVVQVSL